MSTIKIIDKFFLKQILFYLLSNLVLKSCILLISEVKFLIAAYGVVSFMKYLKYLCFNYPILLKIKI